jgi:hypothetical protein
METYINRKQAMQQFGVDVRKHEWKSEDVQERHKGRGMEKWYRVEAVRAVVLAKPAEPVITVESEPAEVVDVIPALEPKLEPEVEPVFEPGDYVEVQIAKKAMNFRFVIGTKGEVVRVQDSARVKVGMKLLAKRNVRGQFETKEVVR